MKYDAEQLARMNRSGQRRGAVGTRPTVCTKAVLTLAFKGMIDRHAPLLDFGAGKWQQQTGILRGEGFEDVVPYDIGANGNDTPPEPVGGWPVVMMSNVVNVQPTMGHIEELFNAAWIMAEHAGLLVFNYPQSPRYSNEKTSAVLEAARKAGWELVRCEGEAYVMRVASGA